ncbi:MAG: hypothetical protein PVI88_06165 [Nitrosopumilaceae archaeon]
MTEKKIPVLAAVIFSLLILPAVNGIAFAQYITSDGQTGLNDYLQLAQDKVVLANDNPKAGSGTPMFAADGVIGALILSTGVFGGISITFFMKSRQGKYSAIGRG